MGSTIYGKINKCLRFEPGFAPASRHEALMVPHLGGRQLTDDLVQVGRPHALDLVLERRQRVALGRLRRNR